MYVYGICPTSCDINKLNIHPAIESMIDTAVVVAAAYMNAIIFKMLTFIGKINIIS